jgi:RNA polymerase sigma-70 factor (ECF subfamily)
MEDKELVIQCQSGHLGVFSELYDRYIDKIYKFVYIKTSNQETAEDITSDVFYKAMNSINTFRSNEE